MNVSWFTILSNCLRNHWRRSRKRPPFLGRIMSWCYTATLRPRITLSDYISTSLDVLRNSGHGQMPWREVNYFLVIYIHIWATPLFRIFAILYLFATHWSIDIHILFQPYCHIGFVGWVSPLVCLVKYPDLTTENIAVLGNPSSGLRDEVPTSPFPRTHHWLVKITSGIP